MTSLRPVWTGTYGQWRIQEFQKGDAEQGVWGTVVPQHRGPGAESRPPEVTDIMLHSQLTTSENFNTTTYTTRQKQDKLSTRN